MWKIKIVHIVCVCAGENNGLELLLDTESYDYVLNEMSSVGYKISVDHPLDMPVIQQSGLKGSGFINHRTINLQRRIFMTFDRFVQPTINLLDRYFRFRGSTHFKASGFIL